MRVTMSEGLSKSPSMLGPEVMTVLMLPSKDEPCPLWLLGTKLGRVAPVGAVHGEAVEHVEGHVVRNIEVQQQFLLSVSPSRYVHAAKA